MKNYLLVILLTLSAFVFGQKLQLVSGNTDFLKDQKEINVKLDFDDAKFYDDNKTETQNIQGGASK